MIVRFEILHEAEQELAEALAYLDIEGPQLGAKFLELTRAAFEQLQTFPESAPIVLPNIRRKVLRQFPYNIYYVVDGDVLTVIAFAHQRRKPMYRDDREPN